MKAWSRLDWFIILVFAGLVALFYWRILTPTLADRQSFPPGDFSAQFWAFATFEVRELSAGRLPLWNPYTFAGAPFWADVQAAVFYPPSLLTILLSAPWGFSLFALEVEAIFHFWLAASFMYLFVRHLTQNRAAAFIAALTFTFSGYLTGYPSQQLAILEADIWLPLILFFLHRALQNGDPATRDTSLENKNPSSYLIMAGIAWGLSLLAGHPQSALIIAYTSSAYFLFLWLTRPYHSDFTFRFLLRIAASWLLFIGTGLALAAIQFIPAVEYTLLSVRAGGTYDNMSGGLPIIDIIQLLLPGQVSFYSPLYVGVVGLILAVWVIFTTPRRHVIFWAVVAAITLLIAFGGNSFIYSPLYLFAPGLSIFRGQERWAFIAIFSMAVLVGYGFNQLLAFLGHTANNYRSPPPVSDSRQISNLQSLAKYLFFFALLLTFLFFYGLNDTGWTANSPFFDLLGASTLLTLLAILAWLLWKFSGRLHPVTFTTATAVLICFDLFSVNWTTNLSPQLPEQQTQIPAPVQAIKDDAALSPGEPYRVYNEFRLYDNYGIPFEIEDLWGASPLRPSRYDQFLAPPMPIERTWELLNVKYVITWRQTLFLPSTIIYQEVAADGMTYVHRLETVHPRAWLATESETADDSAILQKIADPNFDRWRIALLEPNTKHELQNSTHEMQKEFKISHTVEQASHLVYKVTTPTPALLILSEPYYPGWQATVDGQAAPLFRVNYILRAIPVAAGEHNVELTFRPLSFTIGAALSALTVIAIIIITPVMAKVR